MSVVMSANAAPRRDGALKWTRTRPSARASTASWAKGGRRAPLIETSSPLVVKDGPLVLEGCPTRQRCKLNAADEFGDGVLPFREA